MAPDDDRPTTMALPLSRTYAPMEAQLVNELPTGSGWQYEPKWDGFRCLAFRDGDRIDLRSKAGKPLARYFPDVVATLKALKAKRFVLDGEIVVPHDGSLSFDELLARFCACGQPYWSDPFHRHPDGVYRTGDVRPAVIVLRFSLRCHQMSESSPDAVLQQSDSG